ncbi:MarR family winged helix-turn-helix transcriptional regulator [Streptomyces sp. NPDC054784]
MSPLPQPASDTPPGTPGAPADPADPPDPTEPPDPAAPVDALRLDQQICFSLHAASRAFDGLYRVLLKDLGLTYPQYLAMLVLWEDGELPVRDAGRRLRLDSGTLSPLLKRLEAAGYVRRRRSPEDERSVLVSPTREGWALRERARSIPVRIGAAAGIEADDLHGLRERLDRLTRALDDAVRDRS